MNMAGQMELFRALAIDFSYVAWIMLGILSTYFLIGKWKRKHSAVKV